ncbi:MAG TPA: DUF4990 domain-containing protein [Humisphaera sp.]
MRSRSAALAVLLLLATPAARAAEFFVAPDGSDAAAGTKAAPFATIQRGQKAASPGDTVTIRGGTYAMKEDGIALKQRIWAYVTLLDKSGEKGKPITYAAAEGERPVFDFSAVKPDGMRVHAFQVTGSWLHIKGLEVVGVQVTAKGHTQSICFASDGSHNVFERLSMHDGMAIGLYHVKGSDNLFLNCDAWNNHDTVSENGKGGNSDGFGCHPTKGSTGNVFRGCRAWYNSDDGFDCISAHESVTFEGCWAMYNGTNAKGERLADGNGFKAGGYGSTPVDRLPNPIPRHVVRNCLAVGNRASGFYSNHHLGGSDWTNNSAFRNGANFNMLCRLADNKTDVDGFGHKLRSNLAYGKGGGIVKIDRTKCDAAANSFDLPDLKLADKDFLGLDEAELLKPRKPDGGLPDVAFLHLAPGSAAIGKGENGADLGAFPAGAKR